MAKTSQVISADERYRMVAGNAVEYFHLENAS